MDDALYRQQLLFEDFVNDEVKRRRLLAKATATLGKYQGLAEDCVQEALMKVLAKVSSGKDIRELSFYTNTVLQHVCTEKIRQFARQSEISFDERSDEGKQSAAETAMGDKILKKFLGGKRTQVGI
jgi:DNA-directed RNA polymerase specialized sigma24 family protein